MTDLEKAKDKELKAQQELDQSIVAMVKEMYRLQGIPVYEPLDPEWNRLAKEEKA